MALRRSRVSSTAACKAAMTTSNSTAVTQSVQTTSGLRPEALADAPNPSDSSRAGAGSRPHRAQRCVVVIGGPRSLMLYAVPHVIPRGLRLLLSATAHGPAPICFGLAKLMYLDRLRKQHPCYPLRTDRPLMRESSSTATASSATSTCAAERCFAVTYHRRSTAVTASDPPQTVTTPCGEDESSIDA
jgi:hypothetical protein